MNGTRRAVLDAIPGRLRAEVTLPLSAEQAADLKSRVLSRMVPHVNPDSTGDHLADAVLREAVRRHELEPSSTAARVLDQVMAELS